MKKRISHIHGRNVIERVYLTDAEVKMAMYQMARALQESIGDRDAVYFPVDGGGKRDFKCFREFLYDDKDYDFNYGDYRQRNLESGRARINGHKRITGMTDEKGQALHIRDINPFGAAVAVPFESTLKYSASAMVGALEYIGKKARRRGFEKIYLAAIRDHLGIANAACIRQHDKFIGAADFIKSKYPEAYKYLDKFDVFDLVSDEVMEVDLDKIEVTGQDSSRISQLLRPIKKLFWFDNTITLGDRARKSLRNISRGV